jgi:cobalt-zinc-cadmium efflux system protein
MAAEVVVALLAGSLALLADAGHMVSDAGAIGLALFAMRLAARPARGAYTYGLKRAEILSALINGATLLGLAGYFVVEAVRRLVDPPQVDGGLVLMVALVGVAVNLLATWVLAKADRSSLNIAGSFQHVLTDLYAFLGTAVAGLVILLTGFTRADPIASLLVAALMAVAGFRLVRDAGRVVLEAAPRGMDPAEIHEALVAQAGVVGVHELHVWEVTSGFPALSAHVTVSNEQDCHARRADLELVLAERFGISHTTLQVDHPDTADGCTPEPGCDQMAPRSRSSMISAGE